MVYRLLQQIFSIGFITLAVGTFYTAPSYAQSKPSNHEGWYQVELIVFARKNDTSQEHWPNNIKLRYPADWVELKEISDTETNAPDLTKEAFYRLSVSERQLNAQAQKLERNPRFQVLFHNAWRQIITTEKMAKSILIQGGQQFGQHQELEGSIRLSVATYLKLQTNLWYSQFDLNVGQEQTRQWPELPKQPNYLATPIAGLSLDSSLELDQALAIENQQWGESIAEAGDEASANNSYLTRQIILLQQSRDMRSSELHYIDHPVIGLIIQITPYPGATPAVQ
ncbi:CsiV family protein [Cellvibrio fontiphilus]|uniref:CsiV family protein n=1 Tax=Cellvibrio fontiphilus TaxID=1815559 RepID=A0ABV7FHH2_9GAMM